MDWKKIAAIIAAVAGSIGLAKEAGPFLGSDAAPWASIARVDGLRAEMISNHIDGVMKDYCEAQRTQNRPASVAVMRDVSDLETQYASFRAWPLRPCP